MSRLAITLLFAVLMLSSLVYAANVHGTVYDMLLEPQKNVLIEINSIPKQELVSKNGDYNFELPKGEYEIIARYTENGRLLSSASENISIIDDGSYVLDLILIESTDEEFDLLDNPQIDIDTGEDSGNWWIYLILAVVLVIAAAISLLYLKHKPVIKDEPQKEDLNELIKIIKAEGGRINQRDLRKKLNLSEAKVSLMVAELENSNKIKKIKQGRGNIIILQ